MLVLVMAVLLVVTLVACNDDKKPGPGSVDDGTMTTGKYFDKLWELASDIGGEKIAADDDLALHFGVVLNLANKNIRSDVTYSEMGLGIDVQAVVGRKETTAPENTALKLRLYDPTDKVNNEIVTLYMFAKDLDNLYIDFGGQSIKVPHNAATTMWKTIVGKENGLNTEIFGGLNNKFIGEGEDAKSINDYINDFVGDFGETWTLNTLINKVLNMTGLNLKELLEQYWDTISGIGILGDLKVSDIIGDDGVVDLMKILKLDVLSTLFQVTTTAKDGVTTYKASLDSGLFNMVSGLLGDAGKTLFGSKTDDTKNSSISLLYTEKNNAIDSFSIAAAFGGLKTTSTNGAQNTTVNPVLTVTISDLSVEKYNSAKNGININTDNYSDQIAVKEQLSLEVSGATLKKIDGFTDEDVKLAHKIDITVLGHVDIVNVENNGTKLALYIDLNGERLGTATYANGVLAGKLEGKLANGITVDGKLYKGFTANIDFNPAETFTELLDILVPESWKPGYVDPVEPVEPVDPVDPEEPETPVKPAEPTYPTADDFVDASKVELDEFGEAKYNEGVGWSMGNWAKTIAYAYPLLGFNNNIKIAVDDVLKTYVDVVNNFKTGTVTVQETNKDGSLKYELDDKGEVKLDKNGNRIPVTKELTVDYFVITREGRENLILTTLSNPPMADLSISECIDYIMGKEVVTEEKEPSIYKAALRIVNILASNLAIDGVTVDEKDENSTQYTENIKALLDADVTVIGDVQKGAHLSVEAKIGGATVKISESLEVVKIVTEGENVTFEIVTIEANEAEGYYDISDWFEF